MLFKFSVFILVFSLFILSTKKKGVEISTLNCRYVFISHFSSVSFCFIYFDMLLLGAYTFRIFSLLEN